MIAKSQLFLGEVQYSFTVDEKDEMDTLHKIIVLSNPRTFCNVCKNGDLKGFKLTSNKDKEGNTYVNVKCKCGARSKLGKYKTGGFFWHDYEVYQKEPSVKKTVEEDDVNF